MIDAIKEGDIQQFNTCILRGDDVNQLDPQNDLIDPLILTIHADIQVPFQTRNTMTQMLLSAGALLLGDYRETCTVAILFNSPVEVLRRLFAYDESMDDLDSHGWTMLHTAIWANAAHLIHFLVQCGHVPTVLDARRQNAFHFAVTLDRIDLIPRFSDAETLYRNLQTTWNGRTLQTRLQDTMAGQRVLYQCLGQTHIPTTLLYPHASSGSLEIYHPSTSKE